eukprot:359300-Chlamydomonas_euryale.AAC.7
MPYCAITCAGARAAARDSRSASRYERSDEQHDWCGVIAEGMPVTGRQARRRACRRTRADAAGRARRRGSSNSSPPPPTAGRASRTQRSAAETRASSSGIARAGFVQAASAARWLVPQSPVPPPPPLLPLRPRRSLSFPLGAPARSPKQTEPQPPPRARDAHVGRARSRATAYAAA